MVIAGNTMQIKNTSLPAGTYMIPVTATVTNEYGVTKAYIQNVSVEVKAPVVLPLVAAGAFANLSNMTISDNYGGGFPI